MLRLVGWLTRHPEQAAEHLRRYAALAEAEAAYAARVWRRRLVCGAAAVALLGAGLAWLGMALLLGLQSTAAPQPWWWWSLPLWPLAAGTACAVVALGRLQLAPFATLKAQVAIDGAGWPPDEAANEGDAANDGVPAAARAGG